MLLSISVVLLGTVLALFCPQYLSDITDEISAAISDSRAIDMDLIFRDILILLALYGGGLVITVIADYVLAVASETLSNKMRRDAAAKLDRMPLSSIDAASTGDLMSRMTTDCDTVGRYAGDSLRMLCVGVLSIAGSIVMMLVTEWRLALVTLAPAVIGFAALYGVTRFTQPFFRAQQRDLGQMNGLVEETYYGQDIVKLYGGEAEASERFAEINSRIYNSSFKSRAATSMMPHAMGFVSNIGYVLVCIAGSIMVLDGEIGYGTVVAFIVYVRMMTEPLRFLAETISMLQSAASASERVFYLLNQDEMGEPEDPVEPFEVRGRVEFRDLSFGYSEGEEVIQHLDLDVQPGSKVAIVGRTGSGKTTIASLLVRFYDAGQGDILVDGVSIYRMRRSDVRRMYSMVLQDARLFDGTLAENIAFHKEGVTEEQIRAACEAVGIMDYIDSLPDGLQTKVSGDSDSLSAGQRQQVTIARAMVRDAPMIILDEATSSVDTATERRIQEAMSRLTEGRTSFVIAHRLSTIQDSDVILVIRDGNVAEKGTHSELMALNGYYRELYDSQFEGCARFASSCPGSPRR